MKIIMLMLMALSWLPGTAVADLSKGSQTLSLFGGTWFAPDIYYGAQYAYFLRKAPTVGVGVELSHVPHASDHSKTYMGLAHIRLARPDGEWRPFLWGGIGAHHTRQLWIASVLPYTDINDRHISWAGAWGLGTDFYLTEKVFLGAEFRNTILHTRTFYTTFENNQWTVHPTKSVTFNIDMILRAGMKWGGS